jgi:biofilm PGA synthesis N-glycosyltransferase PgaC
MVLAVVVPFLNERQLLPRLFASIDAQTRRPDRLVLVDDGSTDGSYELAQAFAAEHPYAMALRRPPRPPERDRLATAAELVAFQWGLERIDVKYDIVVKLDGDLELSPVHFEEIVAEFERDSGLGVAGSYLSILLPGGSLFREPHSPTHVPGPNKFYRRECLDQIGMLPAYLGWDTVDEVKARMHGWRTTALALPGGDSIHLRPTGQHDGRLRAFRRWGECAYGWGAHPLNVLAGGIYRARQRPYVLGGASYVIGWVAACVRRRAPVDREVQEFKRREELQRLHRILARQLPRPAVRQSRRVASWRMGRSGQTYGRSSTCCPRESAQAIEYEASVRNQPNQRASTAEWWQSEPTGACVATHEAGARVLEAEELSHAADDVRAAGSAVRQQQNDLSRDETS